MKLFLLTQLISLMIFAACNGNGAEVAHIPMVAGVTRSTAAADAGSKPLESSLPTLDPDEPAAAYPAAAEIEGIESAEAPLIVVEPTSVPDSESYPAPTESLDTVLTEPPFASEDTIAAVESGLGGSIARNGVPTYGYSIISTYPHDRGSHIQGLVVDENPGVLLEGSGLWGQSSLRRVDLETGEIIQFRPLPDQYFGEGITAYNERIIQLTWKAGVGFVYDRTSFEQIGTFSYGHEGWGITHDGQQLIVSDGTDTIHFWDPRTMQETHQIHVSDEFGPVTQLNELEFMEGEILANVWQTDTIVRIDPVSGQVIGRIDLSGLLPEEARDGSEGVLNGIAYDSENKRLFITGKRWPALFEIELLPPNIQE